MTKPPIWDPAALASPHAQADKAARVERMFDAIAPTYERVNRVVSLGRDHAWRRAAVRAACLAGGETVLDVCCGTGDMVRAFCDASPAPTRVLGVDFSRQMLAAGQYPPGPVPHQLIRADGQRLPLPDQSVDVVSCAFGVRNFQDLDAGLTEMLRVLGPGGRVVILEFAWPENPLLRAGVSLYCNQILPRIGTWLSGDRSGAYAYLPRSIRAFERRGAMLDRLRRIGFQRVAARPMNLGSVVIYSGLK